jgi:Fe-S-cluster containining protein
LKQKQGFSKIENNQISCICCGTCCSKYQARLSLPEARRTAANLEIEWDQFLIKYTDSRWPGTESFLIRHVNGACMFLQSSNNKKQKLCLIHAFKPECCKEWAAGIDKPECRQGLETVWGFEVKPSEQISGGCDG